MIPEKTHVPENSETSSNYVSTGDIWDKNNIIIDDIFIFTVALEITISDENLELQTIESCRCRHDQPKQKEAIHAKLDFLVKYKVFGPIVQTPENIKLAGYCLVGEIRVKFS